VANFGVEVRSHGNALLLNFSSRCIALVSHVSSCGGNGGSGGGDYSNDKNNSSSSNVLLCLL
jgi:hypothetical protein